MKLAELIAELAPLLRRPGARWKRITELLAEHDTLAEYEVARHYVMSAVEPEVETLVRSVDRRERLRGLEMAAQVYGRASAARVLRALVKDPDPAVRRRAHRAVAQLALTDVALPDARFVRPKAPHTPREGGFNVTGWLYGLALPPELAASLTRAKPRAVPAAVTEARAALPALPDAAAIARFVGVADEGALRALLRPGSGAGSAYVEFAIAKAGGGTRAIAAPRAELKAVQRKLLHGLLAHVPAHDAAHGFVPGRSTVSNAAPHQGAAVLIKTDLRDFFPSVHYRRVVGLFRQCGYGDEVAALLAGLTTHRALLPGGVVAWPGVLPQGAPTSPAIANAVCRRLDARLAGLARSAGAVYTRYADDLTFSFRKEPTRGVGRFLWWIDQVCQQEGFVENTAKRRVLRPGNQQRVTGVVVNSGLFVPREERRRFRAILANCRAHGVASQARGRERFREYLLGYAAYVKMVQPETGAALLDEVRELLRAEGEPREGEE